MNTAFDNGYRAYCCGLPYDHSMSQEWKNGWISAQATDEHPTEELIHEHV